MRTNKYIFMMRDELGEEFRAYGNDFLAGVHEFPRVPDDEDPMWDAFLAWESKMNEQARKAWLDAGYGEECSGPYLERLDTDLFNEIYGGYCGI